MSDTPDGTTLLSGEEICYCGSCDGYHGHPDSHGAKALVTKAEHEEYLKLSSAPLQPIPGDS